MIAWWLVEARFSCELVRIISPAPLWLPRWTARSGLCVVRGTPCSSAFTSPVAHNVSRDRGNRRGRGEGMCARCGSRLSGAAVVLADTRGLVEAGDGHASAAVALPRFDALVDGDRSDCQGDRRVKPPGAEQRVGEQARRARRRPCRRRAGSACPHRRSRPSRAGTDPLLRPPKSGMSDDARDRTGRSRPSSSMDDRRRSACGSRPRGRCTAQAGRSCIATSFWARRSASSDRRREPVNRQITITEASPSIAESSPNPNSATDPASARR